MSFLATADLQAEWQNLDLCSRSWKECLHICKKYHLKYIVFCGDGKEVYDPVSIRVIKWWQRSIEKAKKRGITVIYLRGNHDRIATFDIAGSWLSILRRAGAITFDKPGVFVAGDTRFFMLPYAKVKMLRKWMKKLLKQKPDPKKDVLFFHANLIEGRYSQHGQHSDVGLTLDDFSYKRFRYCIGGDIHFPQKMGENTYYVGSAFCHGWDEVNQRKRYLVVRSSDILSVHSKIHRWYDPGVPGFHRSLTGRSFEGTRVRIRVHVSAGENYSRRLEQARKKAERKFRGAELLIVPEFIEEKANTVGIRQEDSDERKFRKYVQESQVPSGLTEEYILKYMLYKLSHFAGGLRGKSKFKFLGFYGRNFLSFKKLDVSLHDGITLIRGDNRDRAGKSNGSGKTGYMQVIPVAVFGKTFKKQKHDHWSNRWARKDKAIAGVVGRDGSSNKIEVIRGRRPTMLKMLVNGHNVSSGMKSTDRTGTQAQIESKLGFTWDTLANAVYMDRTVMDAFLSGTNKQRTDVLSRFQNLERFEKALKLVKKDVKHNEQDYAEVQNKLERIKGSIEECLESLGSLKKLQKLQIKSAYKEYKGYKHKLKNFLAHNSRFKQLEKKESKLESLHKESLKSVSSLEEDYYKARERWNAAKHWGEKIAALKDKSKCPTCTQRINWDKMKKTREAAADSLEAAYEKLEKYEKKLKYARKTAQMLESSYDEVQMELSEMSREESNLRLSVNQSRRQYAELKSEQHTAFTIIGKTKDKLKHLKHKKHEYKKLKERITRHRLLYEYVMHAFSRDGIPAFLNRQLCPVLNKAAEYYAKLFSDEEIQLRFKVEEGEFVPEVINIKGGEEIEDQSTGERALAGLIASFALREVAPKTNLLMLDEPAEGLDEQTSKQFAKGLLKLKDKFQTIFITTHNRAIESALSAERKITIVKKDGISRVA